MALAQYDTRGGANAALIDTAHVVPVEAGNAAAKAGTLGSTVEKILADLKPEAAYFFADDNGNRSGSIVFDLKDSS